MADGRGSLRQIRMPDGLQLWRDPSVEPDSPQPDDGESVFKEVLRSRIQQERIPDYDLPEKIKVFTAKTTVSTDLKPDVDKILVNERDRCNKMKEYARNHNFSGMDKNTFQNVLERIMRQLKRGEPAEEVVVDMLFYLAEVLLRQILMNNRELQPLERIFFWSLDFIRMKLSLWVAQQGGWSVVLKSVGQTIGDHAPAIAAGAVAVGAVALLGFGLLKLFTGQRRRDRN